MAGLRAGSGRLFDPAVVTSFCGIMAIDQIQRLGASDMITAAALS
jgi:hypothetical protein